MFIRHVILTTLSLAILTQAVFAESASYHLKRLEIQARAFLSQLDQPSILIQPEGVPVEEQLDASVNNGSTWAKNMVIEDLNSVLAAAPTLIDSVESGNEDEYSKARVELESLARRLRISTSSLELEPQQQASLELLMLEMEEASTIISHERDQMLAQDESRRRRSRVNVGVGWGGGWGGWGPWGYNTWGGYNGPYFGGYYRPRVYRRPYCR